MTVFAFRAFKEVLELKMRTGWALIQYDWCLYKMGKLGHRQTHRGKTT